MPKATVSNITVTVGEHTLTLTIAEARALKDELNRVLEPKVVMPSVERIIEREPYYPPIPQLPRQPIMWEKINTPERWDVTCMQLTGAE